MKINTERARRQWANMRRMQREDTENIILKGAAKEEYERIQNGGVDWSLLNLVLEMVDFTNNLNRIEDLRTFYTGIYSFVKSLVDDLKTCKDILALYQDKLTENHQLILDDIMSKEEDPWIRARKMLQEKAKAAVKRSKQLKLYDQDGERIDGKFRRGKGKIITSNK